MSSTHTNNLEAPHPALAEFSVLLNHAIDNASAARLRCILKSICREFPYAVNTVSNHLLITEDQARKITTSYPTSVSSGPDGGKATQSDTATESEAESLPASEHESELEPKEDDSDSDPESESESDKTKIDTRPADEPPIFTTPAPAPKRLRSRYATCQNCHEEFDVVLNSKRACRYHPGLAWPDEDLFPDDDAIYYGGLDAVDTAENRADFPDRFVYEECCGRTLLDRGCTKDYHRESEEGEGEGKRRRY